jgi:hypothetical protein
VHTRFRWGKQRGTDHFEDLGLKGRIILKRVFKKERRKAWTGLIWLRMGTSGGLL